MAESFFSSSTLDTSNYNVYLGVWTNWSRGPVFGATLTLNRNQGSLLISFTALFVTIVASRFWRVACSVLHRKCSTMEYRDALHHQRQVIFRNSSSSESGLWSLVQMSWAWRHLAQRNITRTLPHIIFAITCLVAFSLASGFSSSISTAIGDEVLIDGGDCGQVVGITVEHDRLFLVPWESSVVNNAASYAQQVYSPNKAGVLGNGIFVKKTLNTISNGQASCPFKKNICRSTTSNLLLDTEYINICNDLGVNLRWDECILYRYVAHCAPLATEGRSEPTELVGVTNFTGYMYGSSIHRSSNPTQANYTVIVQDTYSQNKPKTDKSMLSGYGLEVASSITYEGTSGEGNFVPESDLQRPDADIDLYFLSGNGIVSAQPVNDPWYRSNVLSNLTYYYSGSSSNWTAQPLQVYQPVEAASPLGCATQYQICKGPIATNDSCGPLASFNDAWTGALLLFNISFNDQRTYTEEQIIEAYSPDHAASRALWLATAMENYPSSLTQAVQSLGSHSLTSERSLSNQVQGPLPDDQWKLDVGNWWNITLSLLQASLVDTANGPVEPVLKRNKRNATNTGQKSLCQNQKIISTSYMSFSLFGLYFTYITGLFIILLSFALQPVLSCAQKRWKNREYENLEWISNETLQLQRLAYEESGQGDWSKCLDSIPVMIDDQELGPLNLSDPEHPMLRHPRSPRSSKEIRRLSSHHDGRTEVLTDQGDGEIQEEMQHQDHELQRDGEHQSQQVSPRRLSLRSIEEPRFGPEELLSVDYNAAFAHGPLFSQTRDSVVVDSALNPSEAVLPSKDRNRESSSGLKEHHDPDKSIL
ncbi:hypothetical protein F4680DRAFT_471702 [Xylaria scruposa]|nr:hypothetical protein F4680DRAFT_471702 [Xylaria scruposa]